MCSENDFQCKNGRCILKSWQCDKRNDCGDNSDEENCTVASACTHDQVACRNGECVSVLWRCDGEQDCGDGTDELNCNATRCNSRHFRCDNGQCIPVHWLCDGSKDCFDNSDEKNCSTQPRTCTSHKFKCETDGSCIDEILKCDGRKDCSDGSDEKNCPSSHRDCMNGMYRCKDGVCIYDYEVCDGHVDCTNEEDEMNCTIATCQPGELLCQSPKRCILQRWICDGDIDCNDGSDEENCVEQRTQAMPTRAPLADSACKGFYCYSSSQCLPWSKVCDGRQDCSELPDEGGLCSRSCFLNGGCSHICRKTPHGSQCECEGGYRLLPDNKTCDDIDECLEPGTCSHYCTNTKGSFKCSCADGYFLHDHRHCKADGGPAILVYLLGSQIRDYNLNDKSQNVFVNLKNADMIGIDYDASNNMFFWTEWKDGSINSYSPEGDRQDVVIQSPTRPVYVRYDWLAKNLYYRDDVSRIVACTVDGKYCKTLVQNTTLIDSFDISPTTGLMFWTIWASIWASKHYSGHIERAEMDGSHRITIVSDRMVYPTAITVDHLLKMIYWTDKHLRTLECADFHGLRRRQVVQSKIYHPQAVAVFEDNVYWADWESDSIMACDKFIAENCTKIAGGNVKANVLMIVHKVMQPDGLNMCSNNNCSQLCLLTRTEPVCGCDDADPTCDSMTLPVAPSECPKDYCQSGAECIVQNGEYICKLLPDGKTSEDIDECLEPGTCSHFCENTEGSFKCSCAEGYILKDNNHCKALGSSATLVYLYRNQIKGYNLVDESVKVFVNLGNSSIFGMDYDASSSIFFWTDLNDGSINKYSLDDRQRHVIIQSPLKSIYVRYDWIARNLYYTDEASRILVCTVDGISCRTLIQINGTATRIDSMDISPNLKFIFWTSWEPFPHPDQHSARIERSKMDGSDRRVIVSNNTIQPTAITVDHILRMIYWIDHSATTLQCSDFNGLRRREILQSGVYHLKALSLFEDNVYIADWDSKSVQKCNKFTGKNCTKLFVENPMTHILTVFHKVMQPEDSAGVCEPSDFKCLNGQCLPSELRCDGSKDCKDGTDEVGCRHPVMYKGSWLNTG